MGLDERQPTKAPSEVLSRPATIRPATIDVVDEWAKKLELTKFEKKVLKTIYEMQPVDLSSVAKKLGLRTIQVVAAVANIGKKAKRKGLNNPLVGSNEGYTVRRL